MDNKNIVKPFLYFGDDFYHKFSITTKTGIKPTISKTHKMIHIGSEEALENNWVNMVEFALENNAKIYVDLLPTKLTDEYIRNIYPKVDCIYGIKEPVEGSSIEDYWVSFDPERDRKMPVDELISHLTEQNIEYHKLECPKCKSVYILIKMSDYNKVDIKYSRYIRPRMSKICIYDPKC